MATVKYFLQSSKKAATVYCRLSVKRNQTPKCKTGFTCDLEDWSKPKGLPKNKDEKTKALKNALNTLSVQILESLNVAQAKGVLITSEWLEQTIDGSLNRKKPEQLHYLTNYASHYIESIPYKTKDDGTMGVANSTIKKYQTIYNKLVAFEKYKGRRFLIKEVDMDFRSLLIKYFLEVDGLSKNTAGRYIKFIKTFVFDAKKKGHDVSSDLVDFKGFTEPAEKVILSFDELDKIAATTFESEVLEAARDWLIIGAYTGQRVSDLLRMRPEMLKDFGQVKLIELTQQKTGKVVQIPLHKKVRAILAQRGGQFPQNYSDNIGSGSAMFNLYLKTVCLEAGLIEPTKGSVFNEDTKKNEAGIYPKWKLITSHVCRRSFATNYYASKNYPTPILMNITAHSTEKMFLEYIGKPPLDYSKQLAKIWQDEENEVEVSPLKIIKSV